MQRDFTARPDPVLITWPRDKQIFDLSDAVTHNSVIVFFMPSCRFGFYLPLCLAAFIMAMAAHAAADSAAPYTPSLLSARGLNIIPTARMAEAGDVGFSVSYLKPYTHYLAHAQIAAPLSISLRQSAYTSGALARADVLYPGVDIRLRLAREKRFTPDVTLGLQAAFGHERMAGEYLVFTKNIRDFDLTGGMAWGRSGSAGHTGNPLRLLHKRFTGSRAQQDGDDANTPARWFTGRNIGFFAGLEYHTPLDGLSLKADWSADRHVSEQKQYGIAAPAPWSIGASYAPVSWASVGGALVGGKLLTGRLSVQSNPGLWHGRSARVTDMPPVRAPRTAKGFPSEIEKAARQQNITLQGTRLDQSIIQTNLALSPHLSTPRQIGRAAIAATNHGGAAPEIISITPALYGLEGRPVTIMRQDIERAHTRHDRSPQEIWHNAGFSSPDTPDKKTPQQKQVGWAQGGSLRQNNRFRFILETLTGLTQSDSGLLYRQSALLSHHMQVTRHIHIGNELRLNLAHNLDRPGYIRPSSSRPVRSDTGAFADRHMSLNRSYIGYLTSLSPALHLSLTGGLLEEHYAGTGTEILYRPPDSNIAIGATLHYAVKRAPDDVYYTGAQSYRVLSGHVNGWYEIPDTHLTINGSIGRYLGRDFGGSLGISRAFDNGATLAASITATNRRDYDLLGNRTGLHSQLSLTLPFGNMRFTPPGSEIRLHATQIGRDSGQALDAPLPLYDATEGLSARHLIRHWKEILE